MSNKQYNVDDYFMDKIDNQDKAYLLGLLYADGCNYEKTGVIKLDLAISDIELLEKIKVLINCTYNIKQYDSGIKTFSQDNKEYKCQNMARLCFRSKHFSEQLALKGCVQNKTYSLTFPSKEILPEKYYSGFIRGYMDGDGGISYWIDNQNTGHKKFQINFCGTTEIIQGISKILANKFHCLPAIADRYPDRDNNNLQLNVCGNQVVRKILDWIYKDATIYMKRKYDKYQELIEENERVKNDDKLYGNAYPRRSIIRLSDLHIYKTLNGAAKENGMHGSTMFKYCHNKNGFMYLEEYDQL